MQLDDFFAEVEAEADPRVGRLPAPEFFEDSFFLLIRDSFAIVCYLYKDLVFQGFDVDRNLPFFRGEFVGIVQEIVENLAHFGFVDLHHEDFDRPIIER